VIAFITEHKDHRVADGLRWGVEPMCAVLTEHGIAIATSTYYECAAKAVSARELRDEQRTCPVLRCALNASRAG
jgi:putative transposase